MLFSFAVIAKVGEITKFNLKRLIHTEASSTR